MGKLDQKVAVITGGARGIGRQIARTFATEGADIAIGDILEMEAVAQEITELGRGVITLKTDVSRKGDVENLFNKTVGAFKKVDILVNNAAATRHANFLEMTEQDWDIVIGVNLKGVFLCTQSAARYMVERRYGKIISIASTVGLNRIPPKLANYAASKAGVIQLTKVCARELGPYGINVNAIAPGLVVTELTYTTRKPDEVALLVKEWEKFTSLGRTGTTQDIANLALFLASDDSSFITGQVIVSDGGRMG